MAAFFVYELKKSQKMDFIPIWNIVFSQKRPKSKKTLDFGFFLFTLRVGRFNNPHS